MTDSCWGIYPGYPRGKENRKSPLGCDFRVPKGPYVKILEIFPLAVTTTVAEFPMTGIFPYRSYQESMYIFTRQKHGAFWKIKYTSYHFSTGTFIRLNKICIGFILKNDKPPIGPTFSKKRHIKQAWYPINMFAKLLILIVFNLFWEKK